MSFENSFWGVDDEHRGFKVLLNRLKYGRHSTEALLTFVATRIEIEEEYVKRLVRLGNMSFPREGIYFAEKAKDVIAEPIPEHDLAGAMIALPKQTAELCERHGTLVDSLRQRLLWPLEHSLKEQSIVKKQHKQEMLKIVKAKSGQSESVNRLSERLTNRQRERDSLLGAKVSGLHELKVKKAKEAEHHADAEYRSAIYKLHELHAQWTSRMRISAVEFQKLEETRMELIKSCLVEYSYINKCHMQEQACAYEQLEMRAQLCDRNMELSDFIDRRSTGQEIRAPPSYNSFVRETVEDSLKRLSIRSSPRRLYESVSSNVGGSQGGDILSSGRSSAVNNPLTRSRNSVEWYDDDDDDDDGASTNVGVGVRVQDARYASIARNNPTPLTSSSSSNSFSARSNYSVKSQTASRSLSVATDVLFKARVKWSQPAETEEYLELNKGDIINVISKEPDGVLYYGHVDGRPSIEGWFSSAFVTRL